MATTLAEGVGIVNESLRQLGYTYQIDTTSNETMTEGLQKIGAYPPSQLNQIMDQMNLIVQQRNYGAMFDSSKNPFRNFLVDMENTGFGIEDIFHELISGVTPYWDKNYTAQQIAENLVSYSENDISKVFHTEKFERQFDTITDTRNYEKVFTPYGVTRFVDTRLANLSWSAEAYLMNVAIDIVKDMVQNQKIVFSTGFNPNTTIGVRNLVEKIKATVGGFLTLTDEFNFGVPTEGGAYRKVKNITSSKKDIFIITTPENMERLKVQGYSNAFNLSQFELDGRIIYAPTGTEFGVYNDENVLFVALDRRAILLGIRRWLGSTFFVPNTHYTKHWLTVEGLKGYTTFFNAVAFTGEELGEFTE